MKFYNVLIYFSFAGKNSKIRTLNYNLNSSEANLPYLIKHETERQFNHFYQPSFILCTFASLETR